MEAYAAVVLLWGKDAVTADVVAVDDDPGLCRHVAVELLRLQPDGADLPLGQAVRALVGGRQGHAEGGG
jgi:hypothetical protein